MRSEGRGCRAEIRGQRAEGGEWRAGQAGHIEGRCRQAEVSEASRGQ
jgi:hypothetical protein